MAPSEWGSEAALEGAVKADRSLSDRVKNDTIATWLEQHQQEIVAAWISETQGVDGTVSRDPATPRMESAQLIQFFDALVAAAASGENTELDGALQALVSDRLGRRYHLVDLLSISDSLKIIIWRTVSTSLPVGRALETVIALEPIFAHSTARMAWLASRAADSLLEEELERTRYTLSKLDRTKSDFIKIAAHELKTPLTIIQGYTAILASELAPQNEFHSIVKGLTNGVARMQALVQNMIDVSLIHDNVLALSLHATSLQEIAQLAVDDLQRESVGRDLSVCINPFPDEVGSLYLDARRIYQMFTNVVGNAIKFTPDGGKIVINAAVLRDPDADRKFVKVSISDTGIGIATEDLSHIFRKFYRVEEAELHTTSKTQFKGGGPGLGLPIAKGIVEAHGGRIWAESAGHDTSRCPGSTFYVMLPINTRPPESISDQLLNLDDDQALVNGNLGVKRGESIYRHE
jgi:signal transduction histidine kinase